MKDIFIKIRATREEKEQLARLATKNGMNMSEYIRHLVIQDLIKEEK